MFYQRLVPSPKLSYNVTTKDNLLSLDSDNIGSSQYQVSFYEYWFFKKRYLISKRKGEYYE